MTTRINRFISLSFVLFLFIWAGSQATEPCSDRIAKGEKAPIVSSAYPVDLSFIIADLKYSESRGVQICEIQQGAASRFAGYDYLHGKEGLVARNFIDAMANFPLDVWYHGFDIRDAVFKERFKKAGYKKFSSIKELLIDKRFKKASQAPVYDHNDILSYHGIYFGKISRLAKSDDEFRQKFPGIIPMDAPFSKFRKDKLGINNIMSENEVLKRFKPRCGVFPKGYSPQLAQDIEDEIESETFVIKPIGAYKGNGVIIVDKDSLDSTLQYIFSQSSELQKDPDPSYEWWSRDKSHHFIIEEFVPSDPVTVPHLKHQPYDGTMRVALLLAYSNLEISLYFIESHWKLPIKPLTAKGTLNELHKSYAETPNYAKVSDEVREIVERELEEAIRELYKTILSE